MSHRNVDLALTLLLTLATKAGEVSAGIAKAQAEGRDLSDGELLALQSADDLQRDILQGAIGRAKALEG